MTGTREPPRRYGDLLGRSTPLSPSLDGSPSHGWNRVRGERCEGQRLVLIQAHRNDFAAYNIGVLTIDEARRIANGVARLPQLLEDQWAADDALTERLPAKIECSDLKVAHC